MGVESIQYQLVKDSPLNKILLGLLATALITSAHAKRVTCKSFKTQQEAQQYYEQRKRSGQSGWKSLDRDGDGKACDCLPGGNGKHCPKLKK